MVDAPICMGTDLFNLLKELVFPFKYVPTIPSSNRTIYHQRYGTKILLAKIIKNINLKVCVSMLYYKHGGHATQRFTPCFRIRRKDALHAALSDHSVQSPNVPKIL
mmetsp:Transcript_21315/g.31845  ORF Transcript_21315/g.31845 Transcript_21315/m.31845 type:complete len:106 (+) Transcript_21315:948-1265(+)